MVIFDPSSAIVTDIPMLRRLMEALRVSNRTRGARAIVARVSEETEFSFTDADEARRALAESCAEIHRIAGTPSQPPSRVSSPEVRLLAAEG